MDTQLKSVLDTVSHIHLVQEYMDDVIVQLVNRSRLHDKSKLREPEISGYAGLSDAVSGLKYGTDEYRLAFSPFREIINHHYSNNDHHPEHSLNGLSDMNIVQFVEMLCDWKAASMRSSGSLSDSVEASISRFEIRGVLADIIRNSISDFGW